MSQNDDTTPAELSQKVGVVLSELRMLSMGTQLLLGALLRSLFMDHFHELAAPDRWLALSTVYLLTVALGLLFTPSALHQLVHRGNACPRFLLFAGRLLAAALLPLGAGLAGLLAVAGNRSCGAPTGYVAGGLALFLSQSCWLGWTWLQRGTIAPGGLMEEATPLPQKIRQVLTECRTVLPGVQALLGFSFTICFQQAFVEQPSPVQPVLFTALCCQCLCVLFLLLPAAYHRVALQGQDRPELERLASGCLLGAMALLALSLSLDLYVATERVTQSLNAAAWTATVSLTLLLAAWFGFGFFAARRSGGART